MADGDTDHETIVSDPLDPGLLCGLDLDAARLEEVARAFGEIRLHIERLRELDLGETHPAVIFMPLTGRERP